MLPLIPIKRLMQVNATYAVLGTLKMKEAGYIMGVMAHLNTAKQIVRKMPENKWCVNFKKSVQVYISERLSPHWPTLIEITTRVNGCGKFKISSY